jgi:hypothetical protein
MMRMMRAMEFSPGPPFLQEFLKSAFQYPPRSQRLHRIALRTRSLPSDCREQNTCQQTNKRTLWSGPSTIGFHSASWTC